MPNRDQPTAKTNSLDANVAYCSVLQHVNKVCVDIVSSKTEQNTIYAII